MTAPTNSLPAPDLSSKIQAMARLGSWVYSAVGDLMTLSAEACSILGVDTADGESATLPRAALHERIHPADLAEVEAGWRAARDGKVLDLEYRLEVGGMAPVWVWECAMLEPGLEGGVLRGTGILQDITARREGIARKLADSNHDTLTGLPNRRLLAEHLDLALPMARRKGQRLAVMFIDLDRFKQVNDLLGHAMGDELLRLVTKRMKACLRASDMVARQGGDEFIVVLQDIEHDSEAGLVALKLVETLGQPFNLQGSVALIGASIGLTIFPEDGEDADTLFNNADMAMYRAKQKGKGTLHFFDPIMCDAARARLQLETGLRRALAENEFIMNFQPAFEPGAPHFETVKASCLWMHPELGLLAPEQFLPAAEENGLIRDIGRWMVREACLQWATWKAQGIELSVTLSIASQKMLSGLPLDWLQEIIGIHGIRPGQLVFALPEEALAAASPLSRSSIQNLARSGIALAVDDFGAGQVALGHLRDYPIQQVRIAPGLARSIAQDPLAGAMLQAILAAGRHLGLTVTAEGIDTPEVQQAVTGMGHCLQQGGHLAAPMRAEHIRQWREGMHPMAFGRETIAAPLAFHDAARQMNTATNRKPEAT